VTDSKFFPVVAVSGSPAAALASLRGFLEKGGATGLAGKTLGLAAQCAAGSCACVLVAVDRAVELHELPASLDAPGGALVEGRTIGKVAALQVVVQTPSLAFAAPTVQATGEAFTFRVEPTEGPGVYRVEILGDLGHGPSVLNLFTLRAGAGGKDAAALLAASAVEKTAAKLPAGAKRSLALFTAFNEIRAALGLGALAGEKRLASCALAHARDMRDTGFFGHTSPTKGTLEKRLAAAGVKGAAAAEVLSVAGSWTKGLTNLVLSPSHLAQIVAKGHTHMGVAVVGSKRGYIFVAVMAEM